MLAGRYELGEELGSGAVGRVFRAHDRPWAVTSR
jgi:hypothetical protein